MKLKKFLVAALAAISIVGIGTVSASIAPNHQVQAAKLLSSDQIMNYYYKRYDGDGEPIMKLTKKKPYLTAYDDEKAGKVVKQRITGITSNFGTLTKLAGVRIYPARNNGKINVDAQLGKNTKLSAFKNYYAVIEYDFKYQNNGKLYAYPYQLSTIEDFYVQATDDPESEEPIALIVPIKFVAYPKRNYKNAYVKVKNNHLVRTYTSKGKFSRDYVYGHHIYKVSSKKKIKGHSYCWKMLRKNRYIPAKYVQVK